MDIVCRLVCYISGEFYCTACAPLIRPPDVFLLILWSPSTIRLYRRRKCKVQRGPDRERETRVGCWVMYETLIKQFRCAVYCMIHLRRELLLEEDRGEVEMGYTAVLKI